MVIHSTLHPHGEAEWADRESDRKVVRDMLQCCHCGMQFFVGSPGIVIPNSLSSKRRCGYCMNCKSRTCGQEKCDPCIHWRRKLELIESGKAPMSLISTGRAEGLPVSVAITADVPGQKKLILPV